MPRPVFRSSLLSISSAIPVSAPSNGALLSRAFTTTTARLTTHIPPESPKFMQVPTPPQSDEVRHPRMKGILPVPREVFTRRNGGAKKVAPGFVGRTAPLSAREKAGLDPVSELDAWKRQVAASRRESLEEGLQGLWHRKQRRERSARQHARHKREANRRAALAPEGLDDVLSRPTVRSHTASQTFVPDDPERFARAAESAARTAAVAQLRSEERKDALQQLYIAAGDFIVDEDHLEKKVDELFGEDYWRKQGSMRGIYGSENAWDAYGPPVTAKNMLQELNRTSQRAVDFSTSESSRTVRRQKTVAEELTGGKME
ncbi:hypothetical protein NKR23_g2779 [Pleurostoma richardsiae]|uniref:Uncharacterized protein n=1 Tax=Pleurostoma richardsiae TaxID=41990 RepID=A0AA38VUG5_9PEZI|nr:hypothetical protein NKR23_g2779 [Pleurostoma richardsiae]